MLAFRQLFMYTFDVSSYVMGKAEKSRAVVPRTGKALIVYSVIVFPRCCQYVVGNLVLLRVTYLSAPCDFDR
jgi:hypothetical protein